MLMKSILEEALKKYYDVRVGDLDEVADNVYIFPVAYRKDHVVNFGTGVVIFDDAKIVYLRVDDDVLIGKGVVIDDVGSHIHVSG